MARNWTARPQSEPKALPELDISGIMEVSLENALKGSSDQAGVDGLREQTIAQQSRSRLIFRCGSRGTCGGG